MEEGQWETICITENEVQSYTVTGNRSTKTTTLVFASATKSVLFYLLEEHKRHVLQIKLSEMVVVGTVEGSCLTILFSSSLDILQAACSVFGHNKNKVCRGLFNSCMLLVTIFILEFALTVIYSCQNFGGKTRTSFVKSTVKILMDENNSQVINRR